MVTWRNVVLTFIDQNVGFEVGIVGQDDVARWERLFVDPTRLPAGLTLPLALGDLVQVPTKLNVVRFFAAMWTRAIDGDRILGLMFRVQREDGSVSELSTFFQPDVEFIMGGDEGAKPTSHEQVVPLRRSVMNALNAFRAERQTAGGGSVSHS